MTQDVYKRQGCTWAPEFIYDEKTGEYVVYWSATKLEVDENEKVTQEYENHAIYYLSLIHILWA